MKKYSLFLLSVLIISSCCPVEMKFDYATFKQEWDAWNTTKPKSFEYIYHANSTNEDYLVQYSDGKYKITETYYNRDHSDDTYMTIEEIYKDIEATYKEWNQVDLNPCDNQIIDIEIEYDKTNHIPTYVYYKLYNEKEVMGHTSITITDFKITK
ncbi:MAG: hypothetical protein II196_03820 [Spirochaetales bacterium]|nr:hypothetical protein [Spirochaetales bacterium]